MSSSKKRFLLRHPIVVDAGCSCRSSKLSSFLSLSSSQKQRTPKMPFLFSSSAATTTSRSDCSPDSPTVNKDSSLDDPQSSSPSPVNIPASGLREKNWGLKRKGAVEQSVAVVKESWNPYLDFRESLTVMIVEKELYSWDSLCELLHQFLSLNSPNNHHHILRAFAEVWTDIFSPFEAAAAAAAAAAGGGPGRGPL